MIHMYDGSALYSMGIMVVPVPWKRRGYGNSMCPLVGFCLLCHNFCTISVGAGWSRLGSCGYPCAGELPLGTLVRKCSQGSDPQRYLGDLLPF